MGPDGVAVLHAVGPQLEQRSLAADLVEPGPHLRRRRPVGRRDGQLAARGEVAAEHVMDRLQLREQRIVRRVGSLHDAWVRLPDCGDVGPSSIMIMPYVDAARGAGPEERPCATLRA
jgi:hypothetical protein